MDYETEIHQQLKRIGDTLENLFQLQRTDLEFRREQAIKADQEKEMFLKMMFGGSQPQQAPPGDKGQAFPPTGRARRPRHTEPA